MLYVSFTLIKNINKKFVILKNKKESKAGKETNIYYTPMLSAVDCTGYIVYLLSLNLLKNF